MNAKFIKDRIAKLRTSSDISARELSMRLGQSSGYINAIENCNSLPSMKMFLEICDYFEISPKDFFDEDKKHPIELDILVREASKLDKQSLESVIDIVKKLNK